MFEALQTELRHFLKDKFLLFMCFVMPLLTASFVYMTLSESIVRALPVGIVDFDNSQTSRNIAFNVESSATLTIQSRYNSVLEAKDAISKKDIYALIVLPKDLEKNAKKGIPTNLPIYYNAELVFIGKNIQSALMQILANENVKLKFSKNIASSANTTLAMGKSVDILPQIIALYNPNSDFAAFILPALIPCLWQLFIILCMIGFMAQSERDSNQNVKRDVGHILNKQNKIRAFYAHLSIKVLLNTVIFFAWWGIFMLSFYRLGFISDISGDNFTIRLATIALCAFVTIIAYSSIGIFLYALIRSHTRAISIAAVYAAPRLAFVGITYPINNMEAFATFWSKILPITKYLEVYMQQTNYGLEPHFSMRFIAYNLIFLLFGILGILIYKQKAVLNA